MAATIALTLYKPGVILWANESDSRIYARGKHGITQVSINDIPARLWSSSKITQCLAGNYSNTSKPHPGCLTIEHISQISIFSKGVTDFLDDDYLNRIIAGIGKVPAKELCDAAANAGSHDDC